MAIETLDDVIEYLADQAGVYGAHDDDDEPDPKGKPCRSCWTSVVRLRIEAAVEIERKLARQD